MQTAYRLEKDTDVTLPTKYDLIFYIETMLAILQTNRFKGYIEYIETIFSPDLRQERTSERTASGIQRSLHVQSQKTVKIHLAYYQNHRHGKPAPVFNRSEPENSDPGHLHEGRGRRTADDIVLG